MSYRIRYEDPDRRRLRFPAVILICAIGALVVFREQAAGEGLYDALARYVGGMILGAHGS